MSQISKILDNSEQILWNKKPKFFVWFFKSLTAPIIGSAIFFLFFGSFLFIPLIVLIVSIVSVVQTTGSLALGLAIIPLVLIAGFVMIFYYFI